MANTILTPQVEMREGSDVDPLNNFYSHISESFFEPDLQAARIILATAFAHYLPFPSPIWMFVVGPPSSGKTAITIEALSGLQGMFGRNQLWGEQIENVNGDAVDTNRNRKAQEAVEILSTININTFLSHQIGVDDPGLLEQIGGGKGFEEKDGTRKIYRGSALMLVPDFTVMASMSKEKRGEIMGQLRRIYDGKFEKKVGTRVTKMWEGKVSILAAVTPQIDKYTSIGSSLGERFIQIKWRASEQPGRVAFALAQVMANKNVKKPMKKIVRNLFATANPQMIQLSEEHRLRLDALAELIAVGRTSVFGRYQDNRYEITDMSIPEAPYRIGIQFYLLLCGLCCLHGRTQPIEQDFQDVLRVGVESLNTYRSLVLQAAIEGQPLRAFYGKMREKRKEALCLNELGVIEKAHIGDIPTPKFKPKFQEWVDRCGFQSGAFEPDGAVAGNERAERAAEEEKSVGLDDS